MSAAHDAEMIRAAPESTNELDFKRREQNRPKVPGERSRRYRFMQGPRTDPRLEKASRFDFRV